jgi:hypothetical protein
MDGMDLGLRTLGAELCCGPPDLEHRFAVDPTKVGSSHTPTKHPPGSTETAKPKRGS